MANGSGTYAGNTGGGYYIPKRYTPPTKKPVANTYNPVANQNKPGTSGAVDYLDANMPEWRNAPGYLQTRMNNTLQDAFIGTGSYPKMPSLMPMGPGGGSRGGGGGGGGGPAGLDQATLDWLFGQIGQGRPQNLSFNALDLPDPRQFFGNFDTSLYDQAGQGVTQGIQAMRDRGNTAIDFALGEVGRYANPYGIGPQQANPNLDDRFGALAAANGAQGQLNQSVGEGAQADQAMRNAYALMAGNDQARQAANLRALEGDRRTMEQNLGLEGNMLNLGVNMAKAKGKSAWDQMLSQLGFDTATTEAAQNWQRQNTVGDTNVGNRNQWNQGILPLLLQLVGAKAPGTTLPADTSMYYAQGG